MVSQIARHGFEVRFDNGHVVVVHAADGQPENASGGPPRLGRRVRVELAHNEMKGWRFARQS